MEGTIAKFPSCCLNNQKRVVLLLMRSAHAVRQPFKACVKHQGSALRGMTPRQLVEIEIYSYSQDPSTGFCPEKRTVNEQCHSSKCLRTTDHCPTPTKRMFGPFGCRSTSERCSLCVDVVVSVVFVYVLGPACESEAARTMISSHVAVPILETLFVLKGVASLA